MSTFKSFEEIEAWQKARFLTRQVYAISEKGDFKRDFGLKDQIRRAAVSTMSNIAEGHERGGSKEFIQFLSTAKGSCAEVRSLLYVAFDQGYVDRESCDQLVGLAQEISRMISGLMSYLKKSSLKGPKYK
jgi:four helix bundle protein